MCVRKVKLIVDADACPRSVLTICREMAERYGYELYTVADFYHHIDSKNHIMVEAGSQEADIRIVNLAGPGDVVVTQDWGLAALVLGKNVAVVSPGGREYRPETIDFLLEERRIKAQIRRAGGRTKGPKPRTPLQDEAFSRTLQAVLRRNQESL